MSFADNSLIAPEESYQRQMTSYRRTRSAIMESARICLENKGFSATSMIDIADTAEISRATLYNHFRDKGSVFRALAFFELEKIFEGAKSADRVEGALAFLAESISRDAAIASLRAVDPGLLTRLMSEKHGPIWEQIEKDMTQIFGSRAEVALTWLVGQVFQPLDHDQIGQQKRFFFPSQA